MKNLFAFVLLVFITACSSGPSEQEKLLVGNWQGYKWDRGERPYPADAKRVHFMFRENMTYSSQIGNDNEEGTYYISNEKLYTTGKGKAKINVGLMRLDADTCIFQMNRGGTEEVLGLVKGR